jgi:hypothetical protein
VRAGDSNQYGDQILRMEFRTGSAGGGEPGSVALTHEPIVGSARNVVSNKLAMMAG